MKITTAMSISEELGSSLPRRMRYCSLVEERATAKGSSAADWTPLAELVAVDSFQRVGAYRRS